MIVEMAHWLFISCYFSVNLANSQIADKLEEIGGCIEQDAYSYGIPQRDGDLSRQMTRLLSCYNGANKSV